MTVGEAGGGPVPPSSRTFSSLSVANFRRYFIGQVVSFAGNWMQVVALAALVEQLSGSATKLGLVYTVQYAPVLLLGPYGGVVADRFDRRHIAMTTQLLLATSAALIGILSLSGRITMWMIFAIAIWIGLVSAFDNPVRQTIVFDMVGADHITNAVSLNTVINNVARLLGPTTAAVLIATVGVGWSFIGNASTFVFLFGVLTTIRPADFVPVHSRRTAANARGLRDGLRYVRSTPLLLVPISVIGLIGAFTYEFQIFLPQLASTTFQRGGGRGYAMLSASMGAGAIVGGLLAARRPQPTHRRFLNSAMLLGWLVLLLSFMPTIWWAMAVLPFVGAISVTFISLANSVLQVTADPSMRGRVMALYTVGFLGFTTFGAPIVGAIAEFSGPRTAVQFSAAVALVAGAGGWGALRWQRSTAEVQPQPS